MRAALVLLAAAFDSEFSDAPTFDPEDQEILLLDEYDTETDFSAPRFLQTFVGNATNITMPPPEAPLHPAVMVLVVIAMALGAGGFYMMPGTTSGPGMDYEYEADEDLLDDYDEDYDFEDDEEYYEE
jgi:hypothetical protein